MLDESGEGMVQSPLSTSPPTQISKLSDSELASESEQCRCPDGEVAKIGMFIGAVGERNSSHIQPTKPGEAVTNQCNPNAPEAVGQSLSINEEKPILRRKRKQGLTGGGSETIREKPNERQKLTLLPC